MKSAFVTATLTVALIVLAPQAAAKGGGHVATGRAPATHSSPSSPGPGTGAKSQSESVHGYTRKDGKYVAPYRRTTPDKSLANNYSTKGNTNPVTGKPGTRIEPPSKH